MGRARSFDLAGYTAARDHALAILNSALRGGDHSELFKITESYRPGAEGRTKTEALIRTLYSLLRDLAFIESGAPELIRNTDIGTELKRMSESADLSGSPPRRTGSLKLNEACAGICCDRYLLMPLPRHSKMEILPDRKAAVAKCRHPR